MQARTHRTIRTFDAAVNGLRDYFRRLDGGAGTRRCAPRARTKATSAVKSEVTRGRKKSIRSASPRRSA